ncbi:BZ3500_MvSof-1268-A1-R1_Chr11-1g03174 [Microbotryum saponariae]|uniref:BZ3500_MvSof-1268-A1-R1_Chr11-1g03174 protein n=1 Tax=Microbotryum saponariae TaxID=289078 RepID=A0A2X0LA52_9BASI|nr:BZ3501_MvSof-1269-A2-R1_Chr11g02749 [Microbotryum saponariae]SDA03734.1 BZ3500_MvSof-1268-A1-R1_Chr11-1g03174 [Microbotryum saponariae]
MSQAQPGESRSSAEHYTERRTPPDSPSTSQHSHSSPSTSPSFKFDSPPRGASTAGSATWSSPPPQPPQWDDKSQSHGSDQEATSAPKAASATSSPAQSDTKPPPFQGVSRMTRLRSLGSSSDQSHDGDREIEWAGLKDFFLAPLTDDIDTTVVPEIVWEDGKPTLKSRGRILSFQAENKDNLYRPKALPDLLVFTHEAVKANQNIGATWTSADDDQWGGPCSGTQLAAVAEIGARPIDASPHSDLVYGDVRLERSLRMLVSHSMRSHVFGFLLHGQQLEIMLRTPSGHFCSPVIYCTEASGHLSTFLARLLSLSDRDVGVIASLCDDAFPTSFAFPSSALPPRPAPFNEHRRGDPRLDAIQILEPLYWSDSVFGRRSSAYRVSARSEGTTAHTEYAMTVSFVEEARCDEHDRIRLAIANASPEDRQGLTNIVDVYRESDFVVVPRFLPDTLDASALGLKPRAMEVVFHEHCFEPICVADSTEALATVILGAAQGMDTAFVHRRRGRGLRSLHRLRILHRDVSAANVMVASDGRGVLIDYDTAVFMDGPEGDAERRKPVGTLAFRARDLLDNDAENAPFFHQPWHDLESLVYVAVFVMFILPKGADDPTGMYEEARGIWERWNSASGAFSKTLWLATPQGRRELFEPYEEHWKGVPELVAIVAKYTGLGMQCRLWTARVDEAAVLGPCWARGDFSHDQLIADLTQFRRGHSSED